MRRQPHTSEPAQYRETRKTPRDQRSCWIPVAPGTPNDLSKSAEVRLSKTAFVPATYEIRTLPIRLLPTPTTCRVLPREAPYRQPDTSVGRPKPYAQRRVRARHDRSHRQSGVTAALAAAQDARTICEAERLSRRLTMGANEPVAPASLLQVAGTGRIVREKSLELWQRLWEPKIATLVNVHEHGRTLPLVGGPCLLGIFARSQAGREYFVRCDWRSEWISNQRYGVVGDRPFSLARNRHSEPSRPPQTSFLNCLEVRP